MLTYCFIATRWCVLKNGCTHTTNARTEHKPKHTDVSLTVCNKNNQRQTLIYVKYGKQRCQTVYKKNKTKHKSVDFPTWRLVLSGGVKLEKLGKKTTKLHLKKKTLVTVVLCIKKTKKEKQHKILTNMLFVYRMRSPHREPTDRGPSLTMLRKGAELGSSQFILAACACSTSISGIFHCCSAICHLYTTLKPARNVSAAEPTEIPSNQRCCP